jgi:hypothetical protein
MRVKCPKCPAEIEIKVSSLRPTLRWGTNDLHSIAPLCADLKDGTARLGESGAVNCRTLDDAVALAATGAQS